MGADALIWARLPDGAPLSIRHPADVAVHVGDMLPVSFPVDALSLFDDTPTGARL